MKTSTMNQWTQVSLRVDWLKTGTKEGLGKAIAEWGFEGNSKTGKAEGSRVSNNA